MLRTIKLTKIGAQENSLAVQWLGLGAFSAVAPGSIPGQGTKILQAAQRGQKEKKFKRWVLRNWVHQKLKTKKLDRRS